VISKCVAELPITGRLKNNLVSHEKGVTYLMKTKTGVTKK
jgi:hypothetical protein